MKEVKTQEYRVWRDPKTKEITRKEPTRMCLISPNDIDSMNRQNFGNSIHGGGEHYYEAIPQARSLEDFTKRELIDYAEQKGIGINDRDKKEDILNQIKEQC